MDVIPACRLTPDDLFVGGLKLHEANGTVAFDSFPLATIVLGFGLFTAERRSLVNFIEFL